MSAGSASVTTTVTDGCPDWCERDDTRTPGKVKHIRRFPIYEVQYPGRPAPDQLYVELVLWEGEGVRPFHQVPRVAYTLINAEAFECRVVAAALIEAADLIDAFMGMTTTQAPTVAVSTTDQTSASFREAQRGPVGGPSPTTTGETTAVAP